MAQLVVAIGLMLLVVGGLSHWIIQKDRRQQTGDVVRERED